jgi:hypothetical protein
MLFGDFYIVEIQYDPQTGLASFIKICEPCGSCPGPGFWASRAQIIQLIGDGYTVEPLPEDSHMLPPRQLVRIVALDGKTYLRTDGAALPADRL